MSAKFRWRIPEREPPVKDDLEDVRRAPWADRPALGLLRPSHANRERLAGGPGDGNECPWSPHGGGEIACTDADPSWLVTVSLTGCRSRSCRLRLHPTHPFVIPSASRAAGPVSQPGTDDGLRPSRRWRRLNHRHASSTPRRRLRAPAVRRVHTPTQAHYHRRGPHALDTNACGQCYRRQGGAVVVTTRLPSSPRPAPPAGRLIDTAAGV